MNKKELYKKAQDLFLEQRYKESIEAFTKAIEAGQKNETTYLKRLADSGIGRIC